MPGYRRITLRCPYCREYVFIKNKSKIWINIINIIVNYILPRKNGLQLKQYSMKVINIHRCKYCKKQFWVYLIKYQSSDDPNVYDFKIRPHYKTPSEITLLDWIPNIKYN